MKNQRKFRRQIRLQAIGMATLAALILVWTSLTAAAEPATYYCGTFNSFSGPEDFGIWFMEINADNSFTGISWSEKQEDIFRIIPGTLSGADFIFRLENGYYFDGTLLPGTGTVDGGVWSDAGTGSQGDMTGNIINQNITKGYAGEFAGTYSSNAGSNDHGTWEILVFPEGYCQGTLRSDLAQTQDLGITLHGYVNTSGELAWTGTNQDGDMAMVFRGSVSSSGYIAGRVWRNKLTNESGVFSGQRENAVPAEVVDSRRKAGDDDNFCFIRTVIP